MLENKKVYVRAVYMGNRLSNMEIKFDYVMLCFLDDVAYYTDGVDFEHDYIGDKFIAEMKDTTLRYELFICNYNEISNYLH